uniref:Ig-like domain-containing protein n=1 Tax=Phasianus colchicus TaxID=9054 RepID=A0A669Q851_PHACC
LQRLLCLLVLSGVWWLSQISAVTVRAGQTEALQCSYNSSASYIYVAWYRQLPNRPLQYLLSPEVQGRSSVSRDNSQSVSYLSLRALRPHDSAHYFCAVRTATGNPAEL